MKIENMLTLQGIFQIVASAKIPAFLLYWLPAAYREETHDSVSSIVKAGCKAGYKAKVLSDIRIPWNVS